jgi:hypothetical protein
MKVPAFINILQVLSEHKTSAEEEFTDLFRADPGLLRMLMILTPMLRSNIPILLGPNVDLYARDLDRDKVTFGVPTNPHITELTVERIPDPDLAIDLKWTDIKSGRPEQHHIRIIWDKGDRDAKTRNLAPHAISIVPRTVARRIGENILADLDIRLTPQGRDKLQAEAFDPKEYFDLHEFICSPEPEVLKKQLDRLKNALLYGSTETTVWRILRVRERPLAFLAALCNPEVKRPTVLAFRDLALANAQAFYIAREYDAQREAADDYSRSLYAVAHGYKAPIRQLAFAVSRAKTFVAGNQDKRAVYDEMQGLEDMATNTELLADDAMFYAWRKTESKLKAQSWQQMRIQIESVIRATDHPRSPRILFEYGNIDDEISVNSSPYLWRHLLSKLISNGIEYGINDPTSSTTFIVFLRLDVIEQVLALKIKNFVSADWLDEAVRRVRTGLTGEKKGPAEGTHGYGLIEAQNCCKLLSIDADVEADEQASQLVITLRMTLND